MARKVPRRQRDPRSIPNAKTELQFVNVTPTGGNLKIQTQAIIRANAAHFHWRYNRPPQDVIRVSSSDNRRPQAEPQPSFSDNLPHQVDHRPLWPRAQRLEIRELGSEVADPFSSYACELPRNFIDRCITYNARVILHILFPDSANIRTHMLQLSISHAPTMYIFIMGALIHSRSLLGLSAGGPLSLHVPKFRAEIVRYMSTAMIDPSEACKDENILAISTLAHDDHFESLNAPLKIPKQGPLRSLQLMDSCGSIDKVPVHVDGLCKLIQFKGGLRKVEPGTAAIISFTILRVCSRNLTVPCFPVMTLSCPVEDFRFQYRAFRFGTDFDEVLSMLKSYTMMIEDFCGGRNIVTASVLIDHRNMAQHALLSLPPRVGGSECYRLAALIYSHLVTFPMPYILSPFERLVRELQLALAGWDGSNEMLIWVLMMGGIGAIGLEERVWFVKEFHTVMTRVEFSLWDEVRDILKRGLWFEETNGRDGRDFWLHSQS